MRRAFWAFLLVAAVQWVAPASPAVASSSAGGVAPPTARASVYALSPTPPMGWSSWYGFGSGDNEKLVERTASAIKSSGMAAAGYAYVGVDDGWMAKTRDRHGNLQANPWQFPHGIAWLAGYVHKLGLKLGLYLDTGPATCTGLPGSAGHFRRDARTLASWGIDYVKLDFCRTRPAHAQPIYASFQRAIAATGRPMLLNICEWGYEQPWLWAPGVGSTWRTTGDYFSYGAPASYWKAVLAVVDLNIRFGVAPYSRPGAFNDPNNLLIGTGVLTMAESRSQMSLWAMMAAPLFAGGDLSAASPATIQVLTNRDVVAVDQDAAAIEGTRIADEAGHQVWMRHLQDGSQALLLLNTGSRTATLSATFAQLGLSATTTYTLRDLWSRHSRRSTGSVTARVGPHDVAMFRISG